MYNAFKQKKYHSPIDNMIWKARNNRIFKDQASNVEDIVEDVKVLSWRWSFNRIKIPVCLFYEW